jgi:hypothetical protein
MPFNCFLDYFITQPEELVDQELTKLKPLNYNKFMWWRTHAQKGVSLGKRAPLFDRIKTATLISRATIGKHKVLRYKRVKNWI